MEASGNVRVPLATGDLTALADALRDQEVEALAISFLKAYVNPAQRAGGRRPVAPTAPRRIRDHRIRAHARMARIRTHRDGRRQRLCGGRK